MTTKLKRAPIALVLAIAIALLVAAPSSAHSQTDRRSSSPLVGTWRMTSLEAGTEGNLRPVPYSGQVIFTKSGTLSVQAMNPDTTAPDTAYTLNGYEAYYGNVTVDKGARTFTITVTSSAVRDLIGQRLTRVFRVTGNTLVLTPANPAEGWRVTYQRF